MKMWVLRSPRGHLWISLAYLYIPIHVEVRHPRMSLPMGFNRMKETASNKVASSGRSQGSDEGV